MDEVTLEQYEAAERRLASREASRGIRVHGVITVAVIAVLVAVNIFLAPAFPWSAFAAAGMLVGLGFHWYFGVRRGDELLRRHQQEVETEVRHLKVA